MAPVTLWPHAGPWACAGGIRWPAGRCLWSTSQQCPADALQACSLPSVSLSPLLTQLLLVLLGPLHFTPGVCLLVAVHHHPCTHGRSARCSPGGYTGLPGDAQVPLMGQWPDGAGSLEAAFSHRPQRLADSGPLIDWPSQDLPQFAPNTSPLWGQRPKEKLGTHA